ncbi:MAG: Stk1 family PASTA domain-containing Ser/Thr kinase [Actinomycetota bacterium]
MNPNSRLLGGRYEIGALLGRGGMADVHLGRDTRLGRTVAVKILRADLARDASFQARFRREAQSAAGLNHPSVVAVYDSGEEADDNGVRVPYIVMEYVEGRTLREILSSGHRMSWPDALRMTAGVLAALSYSHRAGLVHRDIKPANVMLTPTGDIKVMDFGIARAIADSSATMTQTQAVIGTAQYLSPEQARGEQVDARSDLYSTGCLLYELLTGRPPFVADSPVAVAYQHVGEAPTRPSAQIPETPPAVDAIVLHALVKDRTMRYQTAEDFRDDVAATLDGRPISSAASSGRAAGAMATQAIPATDAGNGTSSLSTTVFGAPPNTAHSLPMQEDASKEPESTKRRGAVWVLVGLVVAAIVAGGALLVSLTGGSGDPPAPKMVAVPTVAGKTLNEARTVLTSAGLTVGEQQETANASIPEGAVISTDPAENSSVAVGSTVNLLISSGPAAIQVPNNLIGMSLEEATDTLEKAGLTVGDVTKVNSTDAEQPAGTVLTVTPEPGSEVEPETEISLEVTNGRISIPNVVGLSLTDATAELTKAGFKVGEVRYEQSTQRADSVIGQQPGQDKDADIGSVVKLTVAKQAETSPSPTTSPNPSTSSPPGEPSPSEQP